VIRVSPLHLLDGLRVLDMAGDPGRLTGRFLADLGAEVFTTDPIPPAAPTEPVQQWAWDTFWSYRKSHIELAQIDRLGRFDIVLAGPDTGQDLPAHLEEAVWVWITPFGRTGPRAHWRASELTCIASSGNLFPTGYPDRPPVACSRPTAYAQGGMEAAIGALFALAAGDRPTVDVSVQEATVGANLGAHTTFFRHGLRGERLGPYAGGVRELWPSADGHVAFAIRGSPARAPTWVALRTLMDEHGYDTSVLPQGDARSFNTTTAPPGTVEAIGELIGAFFAEHSTSDLYRWSRERGIMLAPVVGPDIVMTHPQLVHRGAFTDGVSWPPFSSIPIRVHEAPAVSSTSERTILARAAHSGGRIWEGLKVIDFGSAFAGPLVSRYFVEHGATCIHVESTRQPDSARIVASMPLDPSHPPLERSPLFAAINPNKLSVQLDLKTEEGLALARRLVVEWADVVVENYAPRVLAGWGLDYASIAGVRPDIVYASSTMWGLDGPYAHDKGFGGLGQALSGHAYLTGFPDRDPVFPFGLITDSLTPKITAASVAAALHRRAQTGRGCHIDVSQIQAAAYTLGPWLLEHTATGTLTGRSGNDFAATALCHGVFPCRGDDRWVALAVWADDELRALSEVLGLADGLTGAILAESVGRATSSWKARSLAETLQKRGVEAYEVMDLVDVCSDPQIVERGHFRVATHPVHGRILLEHGASRIAGHPPVELTPGPLLGRDTRRALSDALGLSDAELDALDAGGIFR